MDPKELALKHFEKAVLGLFALWAIYVASGFLGGDPALNKAKGVPDMIDAVRTALKSGTVEQPQPPTWAKELKNRLEKASSADEFPSWALHRRPGFVYSVPAQGVARVIRHYPPLSVRVDSSKAGQATVTWDLSLQNDKALIIDFDVERQEDDGEWVRLTRGLGVETLYVDTRIKSQVDYRYRIVSTATLDARHPSLGDPESYTWNKASGGTKTSQVTEVLRTKRQIKVIPLTVDPLTFEDEVKQIQDADLIINCRIFRKVDGAWVSALFSQIKAGDPVGGPKKVRIGGDRKEVDFTTGAELKKVMLEKYEDPRMPGTERDLHVAILVYADGTEERVTSNDPDPSKPAEE